MALVCAQVRECDLFESGPVGGEGLDLQPSDDDNRRVLAVLAHLGR